MKRRLILLVITLVSAGLLATAGPTEKSLGSNVRVVYLHGVWVWTALLVFAASGATGLAALLASHENPLKTKLHRWSRSLGHTGLFFWVSYLPLSIWAMQTNWNGLYLAEPRWRMALIFAVSGLLLQAGLSLVENPAWTSAGNLGFVIALFVALQTTQEVMHPPSPILDSEARNIQLFFFLLLALVLLAALQIAQIIRRLQAPQDSAQ